MKAVNAFAVLALFILESCLASASIEARQVPIAKYTLTGYSRTGPYPYYNISVPEDGVTIPITNPLIVYSISPENALIPGPFTPTSNCTFTFEDGTVAYVESTYDIIPQKVVSVSCVPLPSPSSTLTSSVVHPPTATSKHPSGTAPYTVSGAPPPYPTATGVYPPVGSAGPSTTKAGSTPGGTNIPAFTGGAGRVVMGLGGLVGALIVTLWTDI